MTITTKFHKGIAARWVIWTEAGNKELIVMAESQDDLDAAWNLLSVREEGKPIEPRKPEKARLAVMFALDDLAKP